MFNVLKLSCSRDFRDRYNYVMSARHKNALEM